MNFIDGMNDAIRYFEENLTENLCIEEAAKKANCSVYHLQRMFAYLANMSISEYIRRRKMSRAAEDLQNGEKILDIALKYGYDSPTSFNRAFKNVHGIAPSNVKKAGATLKAFPKITLSVAVSGVQPLSFRIEKKEAFRIAGIFKEIGNNLEENFAIVPKMWMKASLLGITKKIASFQNNPAVPGVLGISLPTENSNWRYYIASATDKILDKKFSTVEIPEFTWAIFEGKGPSSEIQALEKRIVTEWLPSSGYEYDNGPDVEVYLNPDPKNAIFEVWIPVIKISG